MKRRRKREEEGGDLTPAPGFTTDVLNAIPVATLNLRRMSQTEAERALSSFISTAARTQPGQVVQIITGKGLNSVGRPVLKAMVERALGRELAVYVEEFALEPGGGGVKVRIKG